MIGFPRFFTPRATLFAVAVLAVTIAARPSQTGAPPQRTGAPGDGNGGPGNSGTCADVGCHNSFSLNSGAGILSVDAPATYIPGETVAITVHVSQADASKFGFEIVAKDETGAYSGSWVLGSNTRKTIGNSHYLTHSVTTESSWTFGWQTPLEPAAVTFYVAGNAADGKFDADGDYIYTTSKSIAPNTSAAIDDESSAHQVKLESVFPNPAKGTATVQIDLSEPSETVVSVYDLRGSLIKEVQFGVLGSGRHELPMEVGSVASGIYSVTVRAKGETTSRLLTVLRDK